MFKQRDKYTIAIIFGFIFLSWIAYAATNQLHTSGYDSAVQEQLDTLDKLEQLKQESRNRN